MVCGRRLERPKTPLFPTHNVWMARAAARLGYRWRWVHAQQGVGVWAPCGSMPAYTYCPESAESQGQSACGGGGHALCMLWAGSDLFLWGASLSLTCVSMGWTDVKLTNRKCPCNTSVSVPVDYSQVPCSRFVFRPYILGWEEGEEKAGTHPTDLINASQRGKRPHSSAFLWPAYTSCCPVHPVTGMALLLPPPRPGPAQVTRVSRPCPCFPTPHFVTFWKNQCCLIFPGRSFISIPTSCTRLHTEWDGVNLFIFLAHFCFSVQFIQVQVHRNQTALPRIHFCSQNCSSTTPPPPL